MSTILEEMDIDQATYDAGEASAIAKEFEALKSGTYDATVKEIVVYTNQFGSKQAKYVVSITKDGEDTDYTFRSDIGKTLKDGAANKGYAGRLKQFAYATGTDLESLSMGKAVTIKSFGKDCEGEYLVGMNGKKLKALIRKSDDTNKDEGTPFKITNDVLGVVAMNGTDAEGEDAVAAFAESCKKTPIFNAARKVKGGNKATAAATNGAKAVDDLL